MQQARERHALWKRRKRTGRFEKRLSVQVRRVLRVITCLATEHDYRLVALAAVICAAAVLTSFKICSYLPASEGARHWILLSLAGLCCGAGIWSTHFVAMLAYEPGIALGYEPTATVASLIIAIATTTLGLGLARGNLPISPALGGFVIGAGVAVMHYTGMAALIVPGMLIWSWPLVVASLVLGGGLAAAAMIAYYRTSIRHAMWLAVDRRACLTRLTLTVSKAW